MGGLKFGNRRVARGQPFTGRCLLAALCWMVLASDAFTQTAPKFEGDVAHRADVARRNFLVTGSGVTVCVISFNAQHVDRTKVVVMPGLGGPQNLQFDGEGAAMLQIINRLAPGAALAFASGSPIPPGDAETATANAFRQFANTGCKIIVDDITNAGDSPFQSRKVTSEIDAAVAKGIVVVSSAGNFGNAANGTSQVWEGDFLQAGAPWPAGTHGFSSARTSSAAIFNTIFPTDPASNDPTKACPASPVKKADGTDREGAQAILSWNDPLGQATNDYELKLYDIASMDPKDPTKWKVYADGMTLPGGNPIKVAGVRPNTAVAIFKKPGAAPRYLRLEVTGSCGRLKVYTEGSTRGHNAAENAITVAAVSAAGRTTPFDQTAKVDAGSSDGPRRVYFAADGTPYPGGKVLLKPDLAAASGVMTDVPVDQYRPFKGTSAAAPHVAAIAALLLSYRPGLTPAQVRAILIASAIRIEDQSKPWNEISGYGIPMADKALELAMPIYTWVNAAASPANVVTAPEAPYRAVCRGMEGRGINARALAGYWDGSQCVSASDGNRRYASEDIQFLTTVQSIPWWFTGTGKSSPYYIGTVPPNLTTINALLPPYYAQRPVVLCSQGGHIGGVNNGLSCEIGADGLSAQQNATVLVGRVR